MQIKQFRAHNVRVPDPMRPGRYAMEERLGDAGATQLSHEGKRYDADSHGWFEVPVEVGDHFLKGRYPHGERFHTNSEVQEHIRYGELDDARLPESRSGKGAKHTAS